MSFWIFNNFLWIKVEIIFSVHPVWLSCVDLISDQTVSSCLQWNGMHFANTNIYWGNWQLLSERNLFLYVMNFSFVWIVCFFLFFLLVGQEFSVYLFYFLRLLLFLARNLQCLGLFIHELFRAHFRVNKYVHCNYLHATLYIFFKKKHPLFWFLFIYFKSNYFIFWTSSHLL